jgi:hypothetical protein
LSSDETTTGISLWFSPEPDESNAHGVSEVSIPILEKKKPNPFFQLVLEA